MINEIMVLISAWNIKKYPFPLRYQVLSMLYETVYFRLLIKNPRYSSTIVSSLYLTPQKLKLITVLLSELWIPTLFPRKYRFFWP